uniref:Uncharacterized protein n=1 Tax=Biomphalaria glabrata TaxID=6526 RepID=A0A2C9KTQ3_BIOGL
MNIQVKERFIQDLEDFPNTFNIGTCKLECDDEGVIPSEPTFYSDVWQFLQRKLEQENLHPDEHIFPEKWKFNLLTRVYFEQGKFEQAKEMNDTVLASNGQKDVVALANAVVLLRHLNKRDEADDKFLELKKVVDENKLRKIDAILEQAYYYYKLGAPNSYDGIQIMEFVIAIRKSENFVDYENYLMLRLFRRLANPRNSFKEKTDGAKILKIFDEIETKSSNIVLNALAYMEIERIMSENSVMEELFEKFQTKDKIIKKVESLVKNCHGNKERALIYLQLGIRSLKNNKNEECKAFFELSFSEYQTERASFYLAQMYLQEAVSLKKDEENTGTRDEVYASDMLKQYLLRYAKFLDWTEEPLVKEKIHQSLNMFKIQHELLKVKSLRNSYHLALLYAKCKMYAEAIHFIDSEILLPNLDRNNLVVIHVYVLKAIALETQNIDPLISPMSKDCMKEALRLSYKEADVSNLADYDLLVLFQKIPVYKVSKIQTFQGATKSERIKNFLSHFEPFTEANSPIKFNKDFQEICCIRSAIFLIKQKNYTEAIAECDKIIKDLVQNNVFTKIQTLILKAKALESNKPEKEIKIESRVLIQRALSLEKNVGDSQCLKNEKKIQSALKKTPLKYTYFFMNIN